MKRVVITGLGIIAPNGTGRKEYWNALREGRAGYRPITLFETGEFNVNQAGEITDFDATVHLGKKGLRTLDRSTRLLVSTAKLAVDDCGFQVTEENTDDCGVSVGTTFGSLKSIAEFDEATLKDGPRYTNPALFPNTVINSPASQVSIWNKIKGFNTTISTGYTATIDAMEYAWDFIQYGHAHWILSGGVEELCWHTYFGLHAIRLLSGARKGQPFVNCPFDRRRNGITFGEGACLFSMEEYKNAVNREAKIFAQVASFGNSFDTYSVDQFNPEATGLKTAIREALDEAGMGASDIDCIFANANSTQTGDKMEAVAIKEIFGEHSKKIPVSAVKSMVGETYSVSGGLAAAAAVGAIHEGFIPPTINYREPDPECPLDVVPNESRKMDIRTALVITASPSGNNACMILKKMK